jgi:hypothetical protein
MSRRRVVQAVVAVVVVLGAWALVSALLARSDVQRARDRLTAVREHGSDTDAVAKALDAAARDLRSAHHKLRQPGPLVVARVPFVGRPFVAIRTIDETAATVVDAARDVLAEVRAAPLVGDKKVDVRRVAAVSAALRKAADRTARVPHRLASLRTTFTPGVVGANVRRARNELGGVPDGLRRSAGALDALAGVLGAGGDRRLLVVLENNAELRGTGGLISVFAEATARDGRVDLGKFKDIVDVAESKGFARTVPAPPDYVARYGKFLANTTLWRNANMSPDVPTSAAVLAELADLSLKHRPDAVILLDVRAIAAVLGATGPATLPDGRTLSEDNAVDELLSRAYTGVPDTRAGQDERRRRLRAAADAVVGKLFGGEAPAVSLGLALGDAAAGRHVAVWSARPAEEAAFEAAGAAGQVRDDTTDLAMVTVHNLGGGGAEGNKLDYYARADLGIDVRVDRDHAVTRRTFRLRNTAPAHGLPRYVAGVERPGESRSLVSFALPAGAEVETFRRNDSDLAPATQREGGHLVLDDSVALAPGTEATWTLVYRTPLRGHRYSLRVVPQALAFDATLRLAVTSGSSAFFRTVRDESPLTGERHIEVAAARGHWWERVGRRVRHFWDEPVKVGGQPPEPLSTWPTVRTTIFTSVQNDQFSM